MIIQPIDQFKFFLFGFAVILTFSNIWFVMTVRKRDTIRYFDAMIRFCVVGLGLAAVQLPVTIFFTVYPNSLIGIICSIVSATANVVCLLHFQNKKQKAIEKKKIRRTTSWS